MSEPQLDLFGAEQPLETLDWPGLLQELVRREVALGARLSADEAGAILHSIAGKHDDSVRCGYCPRDGSEALRRLRRRAGLAEEQARSPRLADNSTAGPRARGGDPSTSHAAARSIPAGALRDSQEAILRLYRQHGPMSDDLLVEVYLEAVDDGFRPIQSVSGIRTRRAELVDAGVVRDSGRKIRLEPSGRNAIVWELAAEVAPRYAPEPDL